MASDFQDLFTYSLGVGLIVMTLFVGVFNQAGIGPANTAPSVTYTDSDAMTIISPGDSQTNEYDSGASDIASMGFWTIVGGLRTMLLDFVPYCTKYNIPTFISAPAQALIWLLFGYEMLMLKKIIWG